MDYVNELTHIGEAANVEVAALTSAVAAKDEELAQAAAAVALLEAENKKLREQLEGGQRGTLLGTSIGAPVPGHPGPFNVVRTYLQPGDRPQKWDSDNLVREAFGRVATGGVLWVSGKDAPDTWIESFLVSCKQHADALGIVVLYTQNHEYGNDGPKNSYPSAAQITEYQRRWALVVAAADKAGVATATCNLGHTGFSTGTSGSPAKWDPLEVPGATYVGFDLYNPGIQTPKAYVDPATLFAPNIAYAKSKGKPLVIGETGTGVVGTDTAGRVEWTRKLRAVMEDPASNIAIAAWWNQADVIMDQATADAWLS